MEGIEKAVPSVQLSAKLITHINKVLTLDVDDEIKKELHEYSKAKEGASLPFRLVRHVFQTLTDAGETIYLHEMLGEGDLVLPSVKFPERNPELEARIRKLKAAEEEREYRRMTQNVDVVVKNDIRFQEDVKSVNRQMIAVFNFLVTVGGAFAFGYKGTELAVGKVLPAQLICGLVFGTIVFIADLYFLLKYSPQ